MGMRTRILWAAVTVLGLAGWALAATGGIPGWQIYFLPEQFPNEVRVMSQCLDGGDLAYVARDAGGSVSLVVLPGDPRCIGALTARRQR
jgi:hypothetical protein